MTKACKQNLQMEVTEVFVIGSQQFRSIKSPIPKLLIIALLVH